MANIYIFCSQLLLPPCYSHTNTHPEFTVACLTHTIYLVYLGTILLSSLATLIDPTSLNSSLAYLTVPLTRPTERLQAITGSFSVITTFLQKLPTSSFIASDYKWEHHPVRRCGVRAEMTSHGQRNPMLSGNQKERFQAYITSVLSPHTRNHSPHQTLCLYITMWSLSNFPSVRGDL